MKNTLAKIIIFFLLGSNVVWAFDVSEQFEEFEIQNQIIFSSLNTASHSATDHAKSDHENTTVPCDHCCHGNAHFLGIFSGQPELSSFIVSTAVRSFSKHLTTTNYQPPTPPPNV